jgi:hypothetical protein
VAIYRVISGIAVNDFASALTWYERLLGRRTTLTGTLTGTGYRRNTPHPAKYL